MNLRNGKKYNHTNNYQKEPVLQINKSSKWLSDFQLQFYFETFSQDITKTKKNVWFFDPSTTHFLKLGSLFDHQAAVDIIKNIGWSENPLIRYVPTIQKSISFECRLNVLVNTKHNYTIILPKSKQY